jgi:hypothetical protein
MVTCLRKLDIHFSEILWSFQGYWSRRSLMVAAISVVVYGLHHFRKCDNAGDSNQPRARLSGIVVAGGLEHSCTGRQKGDVKPGGDDEASTKDHWRSGEFAPDQVGDERSGD